MTKLIAIVLLLCLAFSAYADKRCTGRVTGGTAYFKIDTVIGYFSLTLVRKGNGKSLKVKGKCDYSQSGETYVCFATKNGEEFTVYHAVKFPSSALIRIDKTNSQLKCDLGK